MLAIALSFILSLAACGIHATQVVGIPTSAKGQCGDQSVPTDERTGKTTWQGVEAFISNTVSSQPEQIVPEDTSPIIYRIGDKYSEASLHYTTQLASPGTLVCNVLAYRWKTFFDKRSTWPIAYSDTRQGNVVSDIPFPTVPDVNPAALADSLKLPSGMIIVFVDRVYFYLDGQVKVHESEPLCLFLGSDFIPIQDCTV